MLSSSQRVAISIIGTGGIHVMERTPERSRSTAGGGDQMKPARRPKVAHLESVAT